MKQKIIHISLNRKQTKWAFITKIQVKHYKKRYNSIDSSKTLNNSITLMPSSKFNSTSSYSSTKKSRYNDTKWHNKSTKTYFSSRGELNRHSNKFSSRLTHESSSLIRNKILRSSSSLITYKHSISSNVNSSSNPILHDNHQNKREFYIRYQKIPYMNQLPFSLASSSTMSIGSSNYNNNNGEYYLSKTLNAKSIHNKKNTIKDTIDYSRQIDSYSHNARFNQKNNNRYRTSEVYYKRGYGHKSQLSLDYERNSYQYTSSKKRMNSVERRKKGNSIESDDSKHMSSRHLVVKYLNYDHFINKKNKNKNNNDNKVEKNISNSIREDGNVSNAKVLPKKLEHSSLSSKKYQNLTTYDELYKSKKYISPNKELFNFFFKDKDTINPIRQVNKNKEEENNQTKSNKELLSKAIIIEKEKLMHSNINQFTIEGKKVSSLPQLIPILKSSNDNSNSQLTFLKYEIYHNYNINYSNSAIQTDKQSNDKKENNNANSKKHNINGFNSNNHTSSNNNNTDTNINNSTIDQLERVNSIDKSMIHCNNINPTEKIQTFSYNEHTIDNSSLCNDNKSINFKVKDEGEIDISLLGPIKTDESIVDSQSKIKLHIETKQIPNPVYHTSSIDCSFTSKACKSDAKITNSVESILKELHLNIKTQHELISKFYSERPSTDNIKLLFQVSNQNQIYLKKLIAVENIIPKGNMSYLNKIKSNSTLQDILLCELVDIRTKKEVKDNLNLIIQLINKNAKIIQSIMLQYKC